jgi:hypothetical protein
MKKKLLHGLLVALASFAVMFFPLDDDFREFDAVGIHAEVLKASIRSSDASHERVYLSPALFPCQSKKFLRSGSVAPAPALIAISTCVLRC